MVLVIDSKPERARSLLDAVHAQGAKGVIARSPDRGAGAGARAPSRRRSLLAGEMARVESVLGQLKKHPDTRHLPVVMIGDAAARIDALRAGAAVFLEDPVDDEALEARAASSSSAWRDVPHRGSR